MDASLPATIRALWRFVWPTVLHLGVLLGIVVCLLPWVKEVASNRLKVSQADGVLAALRSDTAKALGIPKLAPVVTFAAIVFVLIVAHDTARWVGAALPPVVLTHSPSDVLQVERTEQLLNVWDHYPNVQSVSDLAATIDLLYEQHADDYGYEHWRRKSHRAQTIFIFAKFYFVWAVSCVLITAWRGWGPVQKDRLGLVLLASVVVAIAAVGYKVRSDARFADAKVTVAARVVSLSSAPIEPRADREALRSDIDASRESMGAAWSLGLPSWTW